jgi:DNA-binding NtrC family response regulator
VDPLGVCILFSPPDQRTMEMLIDNNYGRATVSARVGNSETAVLSLTAFHLKSLKSMLQLLLNEVEFLEELIPTGGADAMFDMSLDQRLEVVEKEILRGALRATGGHQVRAAKMLNIGSTTLNAKLKRFGIDPRLFITCNSDTELTSHDESL